MTFLSIQKKKSVDRILSSFPIFLNLVTCDHLSLLDYIFRWYLVSDKIIHLINLSL